MSEFRLTDSGQAIFDHTDKIVAAYERGRAAGRAEAVLELRELAERNRRLASKSPPGASRDAWRGEAVTLEGAAIELEARAKAPAERQDGGGRA